MRPARALLPMLLLAACGGDGPHAPAAPTAPAPPGIAREMPTPAAFHEHVLALVDAYPRDGTHAYHWPREGGWLGVTRDLHYDGRLFAAGDPEARCHCSGLTFEVFLRAWQRWCRGTGRPERVSDLDFEGLGRFQRAWFGTDGDRRTLRTALLSFGLGVEIEDWEQARAGDFVQLWRHSGSGHSCIFLGWLREGNRIVGLRYWSTQGSTNGIGEREERFGAGGSSLLRDAFWICRVGLPADGS